MRLCAKVGVAKGGIGNGIHLVILARGVGRARRRHGLATVNAGFAGRLAWRSPHRPPPCATNLR
jgi:hypothetical protein